MANIYKAFPIILFFQFCVIAFSFAQQSSSDTTTGISIYVNKKAGVTSTFSCANIVLPKDYIRGTISATTSGPLIYVPKDDSKDNQAGLQGIVKADVTKSPAPGLEANGKLFIEYEVADKNNSRLVKKMRMKVKFDIYSIKVYMKDTIPMCEGKKINIPCFASPAGGSYDWSVTGDIMLLGKTNDHVSQIVANGKGSGIATVKYSIGGISYTSHSLVLNIDKPVITTPDTITVFSGNVFTIKPKFMPEAGDCEWIVKKPLKLFGDNMNYGSARIYAGSPGIATVSILYKACTEVSRKNIVIIVKNSRDATANLANASAMKNIDGNQFNGYYGYGYFGYNSYYNSSSNRLDRGLPGPYISYKNSAKLDLAKPSIIENNIIVPDSIVIGSGDKQEIKPFIAPEGGSFSWEASGGIKVLWASLKPTAFIQGLEEGTGYAKVTYTDGNKVIVKKIKVIVTP